MKKNITMIVVALLLVVGIVGAGGLYNHLNGKFKGNRLQDWDGIPLNPQFIENSNGEQVFTPVEPDPVEPPVEPDPVEPPVEPDPVEPPVEPDPVEPPVEPDPVEPDPVEPPEEEKPTSPPAQEDSPKPSITLAVPDFTVLDEDGNPVKLSDFAGKPIVLNFWATWCYYCKQEMPAFDRAYRQFPDVQFVMVNATDGIHETVNGVKTYVSENRFGFDVLFDINREAIYAYGVTSFPQTFFISADGKPVVYVSGMLDYETLLQGIEMITP